MVMKGKVRQVVADELLLIDGEHGSAFYVVPRPAIRLDRRASQRPPEEQKQQQPPQQQQQPTPQQQQSSSSAAPLQPIPLQRIGRQWPEAVWLRGVLGADECAGLIRSLESTDEFAMRAGGQDRRRSDVIVWVSPPAFVRELWRRLAPSLLPMMLRSPHVPAGHRPAGLNARLRCYRYTPGQAFSPHYDAAQASTVVGTTPTGEPWVTEDESQLSWYTLLIYLNDGRGSLPAKPARGAAEAAEGFTGGATSLMSGAADGRPCDKAGERGEARESVRVVPKAGAALVFPHGEHPCSVLHAGDEVVSGTKYVIRTDVLFAHVR